MDELASLLLELELLQDLPRPAPASQANHAAGSENPLHAEDASDANSGEESSAAAAAGSNTARSNSGEIGNDSSQSVRDRLAAMFSAGRSENPSGFLFSSRPPTPAAGAIATASAASANARAATDARDSIIDSDEASSDDDIVVVTPAQRRSQLNMQQEQLREADDRHFLNLARRAEEAALLNQAILMSLQMPQARGNASGNAPAPRRENVELLVAMGFSEARAEEVLRQTGDNVELAADRLLSADA